MYKDVCLYIQMVHVCVCTHTHIWEYFKYILSSLTNRPDPQLKMLNRYSVFCLYSFSSHSVLSYCPVSGQVFLPGPKFVTTIF